MQNEQDSTNPSPADNDARPTPVPVEVVQAGHHGWTLVFIALGICLIACCILLPEMDENRKQLFQVAKLRVDLEHVRQQVAINDEFIRRLGRDPVLGERLAQRQMNRIRKGASVLELEESGKPMERSPYSLVTMPPPPPMPEYIPVSGRLAAICRDPRKRLFLIGGGLMFLATGLVLGSSGGMARGS